MSAESLSFQEIVVLLIRGAGGKIDVPMEYFEESPKAYTLYAEDDLQREVRTFYVEESGSESR